jgi:hypothetical protein
MLLNQIVDPLEMRDNALQCTIASVPIRFAGSEARDRPSRGVGMIDDRGDHDPRGILAIREGSKFGDNQPLDLFLSFWQFFHLGEPWLTFR